MQIYLPIAELSVNVFMILAMGGAVGFLSGMFGVGGGFLMTPLLIFSGIPPAVAVASEANQVVAASMSGAMFHWRKRAVDIKMGLVLLSGGVFGSFIGVWVFALLKKLGQVDLLISLSYVVFLGSIGSMMLIESLNAIRRSRKGERVGFKKPGQHNWIHGLPLKMRFKSSKLYISAIPPVLIGVTVGILAAIMGVGGGFIMVPAMIYLLRMPTNVVVGTSLFQIIFVTGLVTILHATENQTVDFVLAMLLLAGGVIGAQFGAKAGQRLKAEQLRALLAFMVLGVAVRLALGLLIEPDELFSITGVLAGH
jgi:uncharacterized membrane protein YfcA